MIAGYFFFFCISFTACCWLKGATSWSINSLVCEPFTWKSHSYVWTLLQVWPGFDLDGLVMAEGTDTGEMPSFDSNPGSEAKKRPISSDGSKRSGLFIMWLPLLNYFCVGV